MVALGSNLSALWILVANAWMQHPVGMAFNPDKARFEMQNFWEVLLSPVAISKFTHATSSSFLVASLFVLAVSSWFLLKGPSHRGCQEVHPGGCDFRPAFFNLCLHYR